MKRYKGFTLVELMISMAIIAVLSVVLSISFSKAQKDGRDQRRISDLKGIQNAAEQMVLLSGSYPPSTFYRVTASSWSVNGQVVLDKFPADPKYNANNIGATYLVTSGTGSTGYCVCAVVENLKNSNAENSQCSFVNSAGYFCVKNQQ